MKLYRTVDGKTVRGVEISSNHRRRSLTSSADLYDFTFEDENGLDRHAFYAEENDGSFEVTDRDPHYKEVRIGDIITVADAKDLGLEWKEVLASSNRRRINSAMDDETMWDAFEDIKNTLFNTLSGMSWLSKKGSRLDSLCEDLTAQIIGFDMDRDPSEILDEYLSW